MIAQKIFSVILTIVFSLIILLCAADLKFFDSFGSHLNYWAVEYIEFPKMFLYTVVTAGSFWILIGLWAVVTVIFYFIVKFIFRRLAKIEFSARKAVSATVYIIMILLMAFAIRGRMGIKALDWGEAFFSDNHFINQMSLNCIYTLTHSVYEELRDGRKLFDDTDQRFAFYDIDEAYQNVTDMLNLTGKTDSADLSLLYIPDITNKPEFRPNIVIIIMESWEADLIGALGSKFNVSPHFDSLCEHGILFTDFYANGIRTNRGIPATLCSFPSLPGRSIMKRYAADYPFRSIADIINEFGYSSIYAYGGDIQFDNMKGFLTTVGYSQFYDEDDFKRDEILSRWGIPDHTLFEKLADEMDDFPRPFQLAVMTLSFHDPYLIPDERFKKYDDSVSNSAMLNCFYYSDWAVGQFMKAVREKPVFDSTIFVFTADHVAHQSARYPLSPRKFHIPLLLYSPTLLGDSSRVISITGSQVDILPTIVNLLGLKTPLYSWGRDLFSLDPDDSGFAVIVASEKLGVIEGSSFLFNWVGVSEMLYDLNARPYLEDNIIGQFPDRAEPMEKKLNSYIQLANYLSRGGLK